RIIALSVGSPEQQSHAPFPGRVADLSEHFLFTFQFNEVPALELFPFRSIVSKPAAQFVRGSTLFRPLVDCSFRFRQTARPEPVDENASTVIRLWRGICAFYLQ